MTKLNTLRDGLVDGLKDLYHAEHQLLKALPKMEKRASSSKLKALINAHIKETEGQVERLTKIESLLKVKLTGKPCKAMQGLIEEAKEVLEQESENSALVDVMLIGAATRVEHYEMAAYASVISMATELDESEIVKLLEKTMVEEIAANSKLCALSENEVLPASVGAEEEQETELNRSVGQRSRTKNSSAKKTSRVLATVALLTTLALNTSITYAESHTAEDQSESDDYAADNTGRNAHDQNEDRKTADDQALFGDQTELLAEIRSKIVANDNLSTYGKNVKIIVEDGRVTLRGPVGSLDESAWIEKASKNAAPNYKVINELEVTPS